MTPAIDLRTGTTDAVQCMADFLSVAFAISRQSHLAPHSVEKLCLQQGFQRLCVPAVGCLRQMQFLCGRGEALMPCRRLKSVQLGHGRGELTKKHYKNSSIR